MFAPWHREKPLANHWKQTASQPSSLEFGEKVMAYETKRWCMASADM